MLEFRGVNTYYGELHVLKDVNYEIKQGEIVCLLGGNASGKSTTMKAALGIVLVRLGGDLSRQAAMVTELRLEATGRRGSAVLLSAPAGLLRDVGRWGPAGDAYPLMRAVKQQFDPNNTLNPGVGAWES